MDASRTIETPSAHINITRNRPCLVGCSSLHFVVRVVICLTGLEASFGQGFSGGVIDFDATCASAGDDGRVNLFKGIFL
jgi:hypothetical protein